MTNAGPVAEDCCYQATLQPIMTLLPTICCALQFHNNQAKLSLLCAQLVIASDSAGEIGLVRRSHFLIVLAEGRRPEIQTRKLYRAWSGPGWPRPSCWSCWPPLCWWRPSITTTSSLTTSSSVSTRPTLLGPLAESKTILVTVPVMLTVIQFPPRDQSPVPPYPDGGPP